VDPAQWKRVEALYRTAQEKPPEERELFIKGACCGDEALEREIFSMLAAQKRLGDFMATPPLEKRIDQEMASILFEKEDRSLLGTLVGPYRLNQVIASGGMGTVYLATRTEDSFTQEVAVKLIRGGVQSRDIIRRFFRERQILADLDHPNIAKLLDGGTTEDGLPYLVMEYIKGSAIDEHCDLHKLSITERLGLFQKVCAAVQYAHGNLVVHRDIKPKNILVTVGGTPKLLDFGIVKLLEPDKALFGTLTVTAQRIMTPEYASPEQVRGEAITTSTDIFSLGILLYELLTGHRPFHFASDRVRDVERIICEEDPPKPSTVIMQTSTVTAQDGEMRTLTPEGVSLTREGRPERLRRRLTGDLDQIIMKALRKESERRYASVQHLSDDIRRHLAGLPILARKGTLKYRIGKFIRRHKAGAASLVLILLILLVGTILVLREARRSENLKAAQQLSD